LKVMEEVIAMVDDRKKNRVGVVKPALVFRSLFRCSVFGSSKDGGIEISVRAFSRIVFKYSV